MTETHQHQQNSTAPLPETVDSSGAKPVDPYLRFKDQATIDELHPALNLLAVFPHTDRDGEVRTVEDCLSTLEEAA
jgi:hypothetical protein